MVEHNACLVLFGRPSPKTGLSLLVARMSAKQGSIYMLRIWKVEGGELHQ